MMCAVKRVFFAAVIGFAAAALAQADGGTRRRPARRGADAGVARQKPVLLGTDPPGKLRPPDPSSDAGVASADAGPPDEMHRELQQLRARVDMLERERAQSQQSAQQLQQINQELQQLRRQVADAEAQRQAEVEQAQARRASVQSAVDALYGAQAQLAGGGYDVEEQLSRAESTFTGDAQRNVRLARTALQNRDLSAARAYLSAAIAAAQQGR